MYSDYKLELDRIQNNIHISMAYLDASSLNISSTYCLTFKAAFIFFYCSRVLHFNKIAIAKKLKLKASEVYKIFHNWRINKYYNNGHFLICEEDLFENIIGFTLFCMCGSGEVVRQE